MQAKFSILAAAAALAVGVAGGAMSAQTRGGKMFQKLDTDGSGTVSLEEVRASQDRRFARLDTDGDGIISRQEYQAKADKYFKAFDLDGNGEVTEEELAKAKENWKKKKSE
jgi:hypothetical protein